MVKVSNSSITTAEKEKCLAVVKKHAPEVAASEIAMDTSESHSATTDNASHTQLLDHSQSVHISRDIIDLTEDANKKSVVTSQTDGTSCTDAVKNIDGTDVKIESLVKSEIMSTQTDSEVVKTENASRKSESCSQVSVAMETETTANAVVTTAAPTDITKPLTIETKFTASPGPSSESTDTASEVGSCFSSPSSSTLGTSAQNSPNVPVCDKPPGK